MTTEIATTPGLRHLTKSLSPPDLDEHRAQIGLRLEVLVRKTDKFGWDQMNPDIRTMLRRDWMDALADFTLAEIDAACREAILANPNKCPNEGHIRALIIKARDAIRAASPRYEPEPYSALSVPVEARRAAAAEIMRQVGEAKNVGGGE